MILDGKKVAEEIIESLKESNKKRHLVIISVGEDYGSSIYIRKKKEMCERLGITCEVDKYPTNISETFLKNKILELNSKEEVTGIMIQLPLPSTLNSLKIINTIDPSKDVDGLTNYNQGLILQCQEPYYYPCTPKGILTLLDYYKIPLEGKNIVVVGRSNIVGKPLAVLLNQRGATVTLCHSKTRSLDRITGRAEILISAIGKPRFFSEQYIRKNSIIIDVGISRNKDGKLTGDVDFEKVKDNVKYITPVPGGIGPLTVAMLMENILK